MQIRIKPTSIMSNAARRSTGGHFLRSIRRQYSSNIPETISKFHAKRPPTSSSILSSNRFAPVKDSIAKSESFERPNHAPKKAYLLPSSLSFYSTHPIFFDMISLLNNIFKKISALSSLNLSEDDVSYALLIDIPLAIQFPSEMKKNAKNKSLPNFSIIYSLDKLQGHVEPTQDNTSLFSLRSLLSEKSLGLWKSLKEMEKILECPLSERMYYRLCLKLSLVQTLYENCPPSTNLSSFLDGWKKSPTIAEHADLDGHGATKYRLRDVDSTGRVHTTASKKCAKAELWLYPLDSINNVSSIYEYPSPTWPIFVNGKPMHIYFEGDIKKMVSVIAPLEITDSYSTYGIWVSVSGGGPKGFIFP